MAQGFFYAGYDFFGDLVQERLAQQGWVRTADVASAKLVVTYCSGIQEHEDTFYDEGGIMSSVLPGTLLVDLTATTPRMSRDLSVIAKSGGVVFAEAPLVVVDPSAAEPLAHRGLACFAAGEKADLEQIRPILDLLVGTVFPAGHEPGSAALARTTYTVQAMTQIMAMVEAQALVQGAKEQLGAGIAPQGAAGAITPMGTAVAKAIAEERFSNGYTVEMMVAEAKAALETADEASLFMPIMEACLQVLDLIVMADAGSMSPAAISLVYVEPEVAAAHGLNWKMAEDALAQQAMDCLCDHDCDCDGDCGDDCTCGHHGADGRRGSADDEDDDDSPFRDDYDGWGTLRFDDDDDWN